MIMPRPDGSLKNKLSPQDLRDLLENACLRYIRPEFVDADPVQFVYAFTQKEDREIAGLFAALFAWGKRSIILNKTEELLRRMDHAPYDFILNGKKSAMKGFRHRTLNADDVWGLVSGLRVIYREHEGLEAVFSFYSCEHHFPIGQKSWMGIQHFRDIVVSRPGFPERSHKHLSNPEVGSAAKRLHLFLRWMVRKDAVDCGLWSGLHPRDLNCPLDVHTGRVGRALGLIQRKQNDRKTVEELTAGLRALCPDDPVRYDLALFGLGESGEL